MRTVWIAPVLLALSNATIASDRCPAKKYLAGTYTAPAEKDFMANRLVINSTEQGRYTASLTSYWAPVPNDDGSRGTIGNFEGSLRFANRWNCVATLATPANDCQLIFRFDGKDTIHVESQGQCELYHGHRAYPQGSYVRK